MAIVFLSLTPTKGFSFPYLFYASWDGWGHGGSCNGWGLCGFSCCFFCDVVPPTGLGGAITYETETGVGSLVIALDPTDPTQNSAITNQSTFYIDNDLVSAKDGTTIKAGQYTFDPTVGSHGGYTIPVTVPID